MPVVVLVAAVALTGVFFTESHKPYIPATVTADRAGLVMDPGAKVKLRGVQVGTVGAVSGELAPVTLTLKLDPDAVPYIPGNVQAQIASTTAFGAKYVDLVVTDPPSSDPLRAGTVIPALNVTTEINTVFEDLVGVLDQVQPAKLNAVLTAVADGVRGQGERMGAATTAANEVLLAVNPRMGTVAENWRALAGFSDAYAGAAADIMAILDSASTTAETVTGQADALHALLLNTIGFSRSGIDLLAPNVENWVRAVNDLAPTVELVHKYEPSYGCMIGGAQWLLDNGAPEAQGGNGKSIILDSTFLLGDDPYRYPQNLPVVAARGGPGGQPGCGSLPDVSQRFPVRQLVTNTGWGTGLDIRPNPGIGHPWWVNFFPATRGIPEPPSVRGLGPPAIGPHP